MGLLNWSIVTLGRSAILSALLAASACSDERSASVPVAPAVTQGEIVGSLTLGSTPLAGWTVRLIQDARTIAVTLTNERGEYQFLNLDPGNYAVTIPAIWGTCLPLESIHVTAGATLEVDITCESAG